MSRFGLHYTKIPLNQPHIRHSVLAEGIQEYSRIITSSNTMTPQDWIEMNLFSTCVLCFHHLRLLQFIALFLFDQLHVSYLQFYSDLLSHFLDQHTSSPAAQAFRRIKASLVQSLKGKDGVVIYDEKFGDITWPFEEYAFLECVYEADAFFADIEKYLSARYPSPLLKEILQFQSFCIKSPGKVNRRIHTKHDWKKYFELLLQKGISTLSECDTWYSLTDIVTPSDWSDYARTVVWYGRRGGNNIFFDEIVTKNGDQK